VQLPTHQIITQDHTTINQKMTRMMLTTLPTREFKVYKPPRNLKENSTLDRHC